MAEDNEQVDTDVWIDLIEIGESSFEIEFWFRIKKIEAAEIGTLYFDEEEKECRVRTDVHIEIMRRFAANGIRFAFPAQVVAVRSSVFGEDDGGKMVVPLNNQRADRH